MAKQEQTETVAPFQLGDRVKIRHYFGNIGRIVELRGPLGPGGALVYRVQVQKRPVAAYIEVLGDQLIPVPDSDTGRRVRRKKAEPKDGESR